jgi:hypothetical protein
MRFVMITRTEECYFQITRYKWMARTTKHPEIKRKCEQQLERWTLKAIKWGREVTGDKALA